MSSGSFREKEREAAIKKNQEKKRRRRKRRIVTVFTVFLLMCVTAFCVLSLTVLFKIENIKLSGNTVYTADEIIATAEIDIGDNMFLISESAVSKRVERELPFITSVKIKRTLPDTISLTVTETEEQLVISGGKNYFSADLSGKVLAEYDKIPADLTLLTVSKDAKLEVGERAEFTEEESDIIEKYFKIIENGDFSVNFINVVNPYDSYMKINGSLIIKFGAQTDFELKAAHLKAMLEKMDKGAMGVIDLSSWSSKKQEAYFTEQPISEYTK